MDAICTSKSVARRRGQLSGVLAARGRRPSAPTVQRCHSPLQTANYFGADGRRYASPLAGVRRSRPVWGRSLKDVQCECWARAYREGPRGSRGAGRGGASYFGK